MVAASDKATTALSDAPPRTIERNGNTFYLQPEGVTREMCDDKDLAVLKRYGCLYADEEHVLNPKATADNGAGNPTNVCILIYQFIIRC